MSQTSATGTCGWNARSPWRHGAAFAAPGSAMVACGGVIGPSESGREMTEKVGEGVAGNAGMVRISSRDEKWTCLRGMMSKCGGG
jgi:hypothetical protein